MDLTFDWDGVTLSAVVTFCDDGMEFYALACNGFEAGFLLDSTHAEDIYHAAWKALDRAEVALCDERDAERYMEERSYA